MLDVVPMANAGRQCLHELKYLPAFVQHEPRRWRGRMEKLDAGLTTHSDWLTRLFLARFIDDTSRARAGRKPLTGRRAITIKTTEATSLALGENRGADFTGAFGGNFQWVAKILAPSTQSGVRIWLLAS